mmetsp:Transcript_26726/g.103843  ORF Transcript_26726/g.103843 Transcript_26726/m.103843 type:complete len:111 (-) Transcript_26726:1365-1697(-)|eukprot:CAMPEP_0113954718 /NCGR_PEP_ID=MMETSP0011_2-20120614/782_1 /TAXON_ID=101924 /ORGANISM="Rhodosorus marinus" /LENGTH=110 /DNA_ID=CAMNT_0000964025 /DNA_START=97 /DNA_END=429 /DNA_ORIENTATION=- /assembly_acc=CAM_ASM_000156
MSLGGEPAEPEFYFEAGPIPFRTFDIMPRARRDRGGYQLSTWWNMEDKDGNFFEVKKRRGRMNVPTLRILQPNTNGIVWKKLADGDFCFETYGDLISMGARQSEEENRKN